MCDFAADAAAAEQLLVGHVLTVGGGGRNSPFRRANVKGALINERENKLL